MNDILCDDIRRSGLGTEDDGNRSARNLAGFDFKIFMDDIKRIELLSLVLMKTFYLNVKDRVFVQVNVLRLCKVLYGSCFFAVLNCKEALPVSFRA